jgi:hypothetical protein
MAPFIESGWSPVWVVVICMAMVCASPFLFMLSGAFAPGSVFPSKWLEESVVVISAAVGTLGMAVPIYIALARKRLRCRRTRRVADWGGRIVALLIGMSLLAVAMALVVLAVVAFSM